MAARANLSTRRIYEPARPEDGKRILIDRLWPRGIRKADAAIEYWARDCAPSTRLRQWYAHAPERWEQFKTRYFAELDAQPEAIAALCSHLEGPRVTFVFSSREEHKNNATALCEYLRARKLAR